MSEENTTVETQEQAPQSLGLGDLGLLLNVVDLAVQRGAFRGAEVSQVGAVFDKLSTFLSYVQAQQQAAADAEVSEESASEEATAEE